jgi:P27 family predicted phage terminase small subunit
MRQISPEEAALNYSPREASKKAQKREEKAVDLQESGRPDTPTHLNEAELAVWTTTADLLEQRGNLTTGDGAVLEMYAGAVAALREEKRRMSDEGGRVIVASRLDKHGHEIVRHEVNPRWHVVNDLEKQIVIFLRELGLTPLRRKYIGKTKGSGSLSLDALLNFPTRPS